MRSAVLILVSVLVVAAAGVFGLSRQLERADLRRQLIEEAEAVTGKSLSIEGRVDLDFLPRPTVTVAGATLWDAGAQADGVHLEVDRVDLQVRPLSLLRGQVEVDEVRLVRPVLRLEQGQVARLDLAEVLRQGATTPFGLLRAGRLSVVDGFATLAGNGRDHVLERINLDLSAREAQGPFVADGAFQVGARTFRINARVGRLTGDPSTTLQMELTADGTDAGATRVAFRGLVSGDRLARLRGRLTLAGDDLGRGVAVMAAALGRAAPALPVWADGAYEVRGELTSSAEQLAIGDLRVVVAGTEATGQLRLIAAETPELDLDLAVGRLDLPARLPAEVPDLEPWRALAGTLAGEIDLTVGLLGYGGETVRRVRLTLAPSGTGELGITQARAILPGNADVSFKGRLGATDGETRLEGSLAAVTDRLRTLLTWLEIDPAGVPPAKLRSLSLSTTVTLADDALRLTDAELRVDGARVDGSLALELGERRQAAAAVTIDRLDLDAYWPDATPRDATARLRALLAGADAALQARIERLIWRGLRWENLELEGRGIEGRLTLKRLSTDGVADSHLELSGEVDFPARHFELDGALSAPRPALWLRRLGVEPPLALARLAGMELDGTARGWTDQTNVDVGLRIEQLAIDLDGRVSWADGEAPGYLLEVEATHPDYGGLLERLGAVFGDRGAEADAGQPFQLTGRVRREPGVTFGIVGSADLGPTRVTGDATVESGEARPNLSARLSLGEPTVGTLAPLLAVAGLPVDPAAWGRPIAGDWPGTPLELAWLEAFDGKIQLTGKGGFAGDRLEAAANLEDGLLMVERVATGVLGGGGELQASLNLRRRLPFLAIALSLADIEAERLLTRLGLEPVIEGGGDLYVEATASGASVREMMRSLAADARVTVEEGTIVGLEAATERGLPAITVEGWEREFELKRGIVELAPVALDLDGGAARLSGHIDFYLWAADLTLAMASDDPARPPAAFRVVGPLGDPQIVELPADAVELPELPLQGPRGALSRPARASAPAAPSRRTPRP